MNRLWCVVCALIITVGGATGALAGSPGYNPYTGTNWAGFYVGIQGGYGWGDTQHSAGGVSTPTRDIQGGGFGVTWGTNWQSGNWVYGTESDFSFTDIDGSIAPGCVPGSCFTEIRNLSTSRLRAGYAIDSNKLLYITGGLAYGTVRAGIHGSASEDERTRFGWTLGGGLEWALSPRWSLKADYLHVDLGDRRNYYSAGGATDVDVNADILRVGLNYNLGPNFWRDVLGMR
ncbi:MAG TPA: outer membrane protein [Hyphomicrobiaceae bacterium]|nr:outer membrane protein [Hyphomicrobiaceae bacterium]